MKKYLIMLFVAVAAGFQSCDNNDDLWSEIDDLKSRVQALETQVDALNKNVEALQALYNGSTISEVKLENGKYVIKLSNGESIELTQGSKAEAVIPAVSIDKNGYWQVSYDGGKTFTNLNVKAEAENGVTPQFRIDETTGYWQVSYDQGTNFSNVLDTKGKPVKAIGTGTVTDKFFDNVEVVDDMLEITLIGETEPLRIPIVKDFLCEIVVATPGIQLFKVSETKTFEVKIKGVVRSEVTAPNGWAVSLSEAVSDKATLTVTAPASITRATADNLKDVTISVESVNNLSAMSKIQVELDASAPKPSATVTASATTLPTATELTFEVTTANADGWKYICQKSTETAPDAAKVFADGTASTGTQVTVNNLTASTSYKMYVVAYKGTDFGTLVSAESTTTVAAAIDYWTDGITIDGVLFKEGVDGAQLLTTTTNIKAAPGIYFLDPAEGETITVEGNNANGFDKLVIIGRYSDKKPTLKITKYMSMNAKAAAFGFIFKNIVIDGTGYTTYLFNSEGSTAAGVNERFIIDDCTVISGTNAAFTYFSGAGSVKKTVLTNSRFVYDATTATSKKLMEFSNAASVPNLESVEISNNIIYAPANLPKLMLLSTANTANASLTVTVDRNTLVNCPGANGYVQVGDIKSVTMAKNLIWFTESSSCYMCRFQSTTTGTGDVTDNKVYSKDVSGYVTNGAYLPSNVSENVTLKAETTDPFAGGTFNLAGGIFIPDAAYAGYGADLK